MRRTARSKREQVAAAATVVAAMVGLNACQAAGSGSTPGAGTTTGAGPVRFEGSDRFSQLAHIAAKPGDRVVFGATLVHNAGPRTATLTSADLTDRAADSGAELRSVRVLDLSEGGDMVGAAQWPFEDYAQRSQPLEGFTLPAGGEAELLFIIGVADVGTTLWRRTALRYLAGGTTFDTSTRFGFQVCAGADC